MNKLTTSKNIYEEDQKNLDQYVKRSLTKEEIGAFYERYIGYLYEVEGYRVKYHGIREKLGDMGRDLIATKGKETLIIQCKMWSSNFIIHEKHIYQLFGTSFHHGMVNGQKVKSIFVSTTDLSEVANKAAQDLNVEFRKIQLNKDYPKIKCNINSKGRLYHLPFEGKTYDNIEICEKEGEFFVNTIQEAVNLGFESPKNKKRVA